MINLPLFPLHTVLCPGVAMPLHIFEDRYKAMVEECLADQSPFGVVLIREGREVGHGDLAVAEIGTLAEIREATRYADGRFDLVTLGTQRFRLESVSMSPSQYLVGEMEPLDEVLGRAERARRLADRVSQRFIRYLELLQLDDEPDDDPAPRGRAGVQRVEGEAAPAEGHGTAWALEIEPPADAETGHPPHADAKTVEAAMDSRAAELDEAARRLAIPDDPTVLSYLFSGIVQVESVRRQSLLEMDTTEERLAELARLLELEISLLERRLKNYEADPRLLALRRN
jgi:Lon protease-like protein